MTKLGYIIFLALVVTAVGFFVKLAVETVKQEDGTQEVREQHMEQYVEKELDL